MQGHQFSKQCRQIARQRPTLPALDHLLAVQLAEQAQLVDQCLRSVAQIGVVPQQVVQPGRGCSADFNAGAGAQAQHQGSGQGQTANLAAFTLHIQRTGGVELFQHVGQARFKGGLRRLGLAGHRAQNGALVDRAAFQIQHLVALGSQGMQHAGLGAACGTYQHAQGQCGALGF